MTVLNLAPGDFDRNGTVNQADLIIFRNGYGLRTGAFLDDGDSDMDGDVDGRDFLIWQRNYGQTVPLLSVVTAVPEPSASCLLASVILGLTGRRLAV